MGEKKLQEAFVPLQVRPGGGLAARICPRAFPEPPWAQAGHLWVQKGILAGCGKGPMSPGAAPGS